MVSRSFSSLFVLAISVALLFSDQHIVTSDKSLIEKTCSRTQYPQDCITALESDRRSINATDLTSLSRITLDIASSKVNETNKYVRSLEPWDYPSWAMISYCQYVYNQSVFAMVGSLKAFDAKNYQSAYRNVDETNGHIVQCNNMNLPDVQKKNEVLLRFIANTLKIVHLLF